MEGTNKESLWTSFQLAQVIDQEFIKQILHSVYSTDGKLLINSNNYY